jgi:thymidylate synthase
VKEFNALDEMWMDVLAKLCDAPSQPSRAGNTREILGWVGRLTDPRACFLFNPKRAIPIWYPAAETIWLLSGNPDVNMIKAYAPQYERFAEPNGIVHGHYGRRWFGGDEAYNYRKSCLNGLGVDQFTSLVDLLLEKRDTRQAVLTCWNAGDLLCAHKSPKNDIPCTLSLNFIVRDGKLNLVTTMRSNDVWLGLPNDVFAFCSLQQIIASWLELDVGFYQHQVTSMHLYDKNYEKALDCFVSYDVQPLVHQPVMVNLWSKFEEMVKLEAHNRSLQVCFNGVEDMLGLNTIFTNLVLMAATKFTTVGSRLPAPLRKLEK